MIVAVTGASGFIGRVATEAFEHAGHTVLQLSRRMAIEGRRHVTWELGSPLPEAVKTADAIVHLASATLVERENLDAALRRDVVGTEILLEGVRSLRQEHGRPLRFVFVSSQSSRIDATNAYGRSKWHIEKLLTDNDEIIVRPGFVYDDAFAHGTVSTLLKLARIPILPLPKTPKAIQPIHVDDLATCLVTIAFSEISRSSYSLGSPHPITLQDFIRQASLAIGRRCPTFVHCPGAIAKFLISVVDYLTARGLSLSERANGVTGLMPMDTLGSLADLGMVLRRLDASGLNLINPRVPDCEHHA